ncbi:hypothetical protein M405DRAFT_823295 [Rhizopogon salebrosus TDB-379]|nr:hypothetical protein M405DRAFT_823295 [Rhizopogon salebrosus TDB-379]
MQSASANSPHSMYAPSLLSCTSCRHSMYAFRSLHNLNFPELRFLQTQFQCYI